MRSSRIKILVFLLVLGSLGCANPEQKTISSTEDLAIILSKVDLDKNQAAFVKNYVESNLEINPYVPILSNTGEIELQNFNVSNLLLLFDQAINQQKIYNEYIAPLDVKIAKTESESLLENILNNKAKIKLMNNSSHEIKAYRVSISFYNAFNELILSQPIEVDQIINANSEKEHYFYLDSSKKEEEIKSIFTSPNTTYSITFKTIVFKDTLLDEYDYHLIKYLN